LIEFEGHTDSVRVWIIMTLTFVCGGIQMNIDYLYRNC